MSAYTVIVIKDTNGTIAQLNDKLRNATGIGKNNLINAVANYLAANMVGNNAAGTVQVCTRDTDPVVSTSGSGSQTITVNVG